MELDNSKILVTGGAGFIGSHLVDRLLRFPKTKVTVIDNLHTGRLENLKDAFRNRNFEFIKASILNERKLFPCIEKADFVFHLAVSNLRESINNPQLSHDVNAFGTFLVCQASLEYRVKKLISCSSSEVYGTALKTPMSESHPKNPHTVYAAGKLAGDEYARSFHKTYGMPAVIARPFNAYGPREHMLGVSGEFIPRAIGFILSDKPVPIFGDGNQTRDFTYVVDVAEGLVRVAEEDKLIGEEVNIARGKEVSLLKIISILGDLLKKKVRIKKLDPRPGDVRRHYADVKKLRKYCNWSPMTDIETGLKMYLDWLLSSKRLEKYNFDELSIINW